MLSVKGAGQHFVVYAKVVDWWLFPWIWSHPARLPFLTPHASPHSGCWCCSVHFLHDISLHSEEKGRWTTCVALGWGQEEHWAPNPGATPSSSGSSVAGRALCLLLHVLPQLRRVGWGCLANVGRGQKKGFCTLAIFVPHHSCRASWPWEY